MASRGLRDMDTGRERVHDEGERRQLRRQARTVQLKALIFASLTTGLAVGSAFLWP